MNSIESSLVSTTHIIELIGLLLDGTDALIGLKDLDHRYVYANHEADISFGVEPGSLIGKTIDEFTSADDAAEIRERENFVLKNGEPARFFESFQISGKTIDCATIRFPIRDGSGRIVGVGFVALLGHHDNSGASRNQTALDKAHRTIFNLQKLLEQTKQQARTDALTGVWNRRQIEETIQQEMARFNRYGHPFSIIFMDLDHFKRINDTKGHGVGDLVLQEFCHVISDSMRTTDMLGRWGGEEFILLLPNAGRMSARLVAERLRFEVEQHFFPEIERITASFGIATARIRDSIGDLIDRADAALYAAKSNGRNRVDVDVAEIELEGDYERVGTGFVRLVWRSAYECGHELIDRQHRQLFEEANNLLDSVISGGSKEEVLQQIDVLFKDIMQHFEDEEALLKASGYPEADGHGRIHAELVTKALDMSVRYAADNLTLGELFSFLAADVVAKHLLGEDRKFFAYLGNTSW